MNLAQNKALFWATLILGLFLIPGQARSFSNADLEGVWSVRFTGSQSRWTVTLDSSGAVTKFVHNRYQTHSFSGRLTVEDARVSGTIRRDQTDLTARRFTAVDRLAGTFDAAESMALTVEVEWAYQGGETRQETYSSTWTRQGTDPDDPDEDDPDEGEPDEDDPGQPDQEEPPAEYTNSLGIRFILIPAGSFKMGSEDWSTDQRPVHKINITKQFYMSMYEVTQAQWQAVTGENPSLRECGNCPADWITQEDVQLFLQMLNDLETTDKYRLPTEAEWEYACRAGTKTDYSFGNDNDLLDQYGWYTSNSSQQAHPVGLKAPNPWGLYDMHGNVSEICQDWYHEDYYGQPPTDDPRGPSSGEERVMRGGAYGSPPAYLLSTYRMKSIWWSMIPGLGLRLVLDP